MARDTMTLCAGLSGPHAGQLIGKLASLPEFARRAPTWVRVDDDDRKVSAGWLEEWLPRTGSSLYAAWDEAGRQFLSLELPDMVKVRFPEFERDPAAVLQLLARLPFQIASFSAIHPEWYAPEHDYRGPGFGDGHYAHGWACAFKGEGHQRLVSRRWLDWGPWRLLHGPRDLSLVQFHDLDAGWQTALQQAKPGHRRMGIAGEGGFIQSDYVFEHEIKGDYSARDHTLQITVHGRDLTQAEMLDACAARLYRQSQERPVDAIAYEFMEEKRAKVHLEELWLRELQCWAITGEKRRRLDEDFEPEPQVPAWMAKLEHGRHQARG